MDTTTTIKKVITATKVIVASQTITNHVTTTTKVSYKELLDFSGKENFLSEETLCNYFIIFDTTEGAYLALEPDIAYTHSLVMS